MTLLSESLLHPVSFPVTTGLLPLSPRKGGLIKEVSVIIDTETGVYHGDVPHDTKGFPEKRDSNFAL
jgi:hypothetical protein